MNQTFPCPYLNQSVELTEERYQHIADLIRTSDRDPDALLFSKWFDNIRSGRYLIVVMIHHTEPDRSWIVTTYTARKITGGTVLWATT